MVAMILDEEQMRRDAEAVADEERAAIQAEVRAQDAADGRAELLERLLSGALEKRDWPAVKRHADALAALKSGVPAGRWQVLTGSQIMVPRPSIPWVCEGVELAPGAVTIFAGYGYSGKTAICQSLALSVAMGVPVWGRYAVEPGKVLHVDYEQGDRLTCERYQRLAKGEGAKGHPRECFERIGDNLRVAIMPMDMLDSPNAEAVFSREFEGYKLALIDSFSACTPCTKENDASAAVPLRMLGRVSERTKCTIIVIHHNGKDSPTDSDANGAQKLRGSSALFNAAQLVINMSTKGAPEKTPGSNYAKATSTKNRVTGRTIDPFIFRISDVDENDVISSQSRYGLRVTMQDIDDGEDHDAAIDKAGEKILTFVRAHAGCSSEEMKFGARVGNDVRVAAIARLVRDGAIVNRGGKGGKGHAAAWFPVVAQEPTDA